MEIHFKIAGILLVALALAHGIFPRYFNWAEELNQISLINRQMMQVHTFFIALTVFLIGLLCLTSAHELITTALGKRVCLGLALFWTARLLIQFFGYSAEHWRRKRFETMAHIGFSAFWIYCSILFFAACFL